MHRRNPQPARRPLPTRPRIAAAACGAALLACAATVAAADFAPDVFVRDDILHRPSPDRFSVCHAGTCSLVAQTGLPAGPWSRIAALFAPAASDAAQERVRIAHAIARFETYVGVLTGTADDRPENQHGRGWWSQLDCIDESTNTTTYLRILAGARLLRWHRVEARVTRGFFLFGWPHTTAVVSERESGARWAVDSWFHGNGALPEVVPLEEWKRGWRPARSGSRPPMIADDGR